MGTIIQKAQAGQPALFRFKCLPFYEADSPHTWKTVPGLFYALPLVRRRVLCFYGLS